MSVKKFATLLSVILMLTVAVAFASAQSNGCSLTVQTTKNSGTVWGTVQVSYGGQTVDVSSARKTLSIPCGTRVSLTEMPTNASTWQFSSWKSNRVTFNHPDSSTVHFTLNRSETVDATYSQQKASSTSSSSSSWG